MYINLLYLPLFNFTYLFFLFFVSFPLNIFVSLIFIDIFPNWHLALVLFSSLYFSQFCSGRYNFWFPMFTGSICLRVYMYMCVFSHTFYCCYKPLPLHWAFAALWSFPFFFFFFFLLPFYFSFLFFRIFIFIFLEELIIFFLHLFLCLPFLLFFSPCC